MGLLAYPVGNGMLFWGLKNLSPTTTAFLLNGIAIFTLAIGSSWLRERPTLWQWLGVGLALIGGVLFFGARIEGGEVQSIVVSLGGVLGLSLFGVMSREFARSGEIDTVGLAAVPLFFGGSVLLLIAPPVARPSIHVVAILAWLAVVNSALAYVLWSHALKRLKAFEISLVGNLMPMGTALLSPWMTGERVSEWSWSGMLVALAGVVLVGIKAQGDKEKVPEGVIRG